jgi:hypothetical protein
VKVEEASLLFLGASLGSLKWPSCRIEMRPGTVHLGVMRILTTLALLVLPGCVRMSRPVSIDPDVNFAAHVEHDQIVLDRVPGGHGGVVEVPGWFHWGTSPSFVVTSDGQTVADLSLTAPATVQVRSGGGAGAPVLGAVEPSWEDNAIRLTLRPSGDAILRSDLFARTVTGGGPPVLSRNAQSVIDVRGTYRAALRDAKGGETGWLRVKVTPYAESPRIYDGVLPADVGPGLAAATAVALGSEIDWIEGHTLDVYRGTSGGPLRESVPMGR